MRTLQSRLYDVRAVYDHGIILLVERDRRGGFRVSESGWGEAVSVDQWLSIMCGNNPGEKTALCPRWLQKLGQGQSPYPSTSSDQELRHLSVFFRFFDVSLIAFCLSLA